MAGVIKGPFDEDGVLDTDEIRPILRSDEPVIVSTPPVVSVVTLDSVVSGVVFELDVALTASYAGTGTRWSNLTASPADGSLQTDYDFVAISAAGMPTFVETSSRASSYFEFGNNTAMVIETSTNTDFIRTLHSNFSEKLWMMYVFQYTSTVWEVVRPYFSTRGLSGAERPGISMQTQTQRPRLQISTSTVNNNALPVTNAAVGTTGIHAMTWVKFNKAEAVSSLDLYYNSRTLTSSIPIGTLGTTTTSCFGLAHIGATADRDYFATSNMRLMHISMGIGHVSAPQVSAIFDVLEARHGRIYT
jgi:hypothetical protein